MKKSRNADSFYKHAVFILTRIKYHRLVVHTKFITKKEQTAFRRSIYKAAFQSTLTYALCFGVFWCVSEFWYMCQKFWCVSEFWCMKLKNNLPIKQIKNLFQKLLKKTIFQSNTNYALFFLNPNPFFEKVVPNWSNFLIRVC